MKKKMKKLEDIKIRNVDIIKNYKREINLQTRFVKNKKLYNRKIKHKGKDYEN